MFVQARRLFEWLAANTWDSLRSAHRDRFIFGEDAVTSVNMRAIANAGSSILAFEDTRATESKKGCDFELWVGAAPVGWFRYAVQAKKIDIRTKRYAKLKHDVSGRRQIDVLNDYARSVRAMPIYCLYSYAPQVPYWNCSQFNKERIFRSGGRIGSVSGKIRAVRANCRQTQSDS